jgi:hypothetical protein
MLLGSQISKDIGLQPWDYLKIKIEFLMDF